MNKIFGYFFSHPVRIFFAHSALFAIIASVILALHTGDFARLHNFIFLQSFLGAAFGGFVLLALPIWCEIKTDLKPISALLLGLLWIAFFMQIFAESSLFAESSSFFIDSAIFAESRANFMETASYGTMSAFWLALFICAFVWIIKSKNSQNLALLFSLFCIFTLTLAQIWAREAKISYAFIHICIFATLIISFRVSLVLGNEVLKSLPNASVLIFLPNPALKNISCFLVLMLAIATLWGKSDNLNAFLSLGVGFSTLSRLSSWHYRVFFATHYTLILYALFLGLGISYIALGVAYFGVFYASNALHFLSIFVLLGFVLFVFNTASLRHSQNQNFIFSPTTRFSFVALFFASIARAILWIFISAFYIIIPALLIMWVFLYFAIKFFKVYKESDFNGED